ncbi:MAG: tetratricopeptide repeat protein [Candidatus Poribacteria bacterium]|nr:tetratricopeptide repeat protein [Candidatus Poribacteria bacterium]
MRSLIVGLSAAWIAAALTVPLHAQDLLATIRQYEQAVQASPKSATAHRNLGFAYLAADGFDDARQAFQAVRELDPSSPVGAYWQGRVAFLQQRFQEAIDAFEHAAPMLGEWGEVYAEIGRAYHHEHRADAAVAALRVAEEKMSRDVPPPLELIPPSYESVDPQWVSKTVPQTLADVYYTLGLAVFSQGDDTAARNYWDRALKLTPAGEIHFQLGLVAMRQARLNDAVASFESAIEKKPDLAQAHYQLGLAYYRLGRTDDGNAQMETWRRIEAEHAARDEQRAAVVNADDKSLALIESGGTFLNRGQYEDAAREYQKALWHKPGSVGARNALAVANALLGRFEEAFAAAREAVDMAPEKGETRAALAFVLRKQAESTENETTLREALNAYRSAVDLKHDFSEAWLAVGQLHARFGEVVQAEAAYQTLLELTEEGGSMSPAEAHQGLADLAMRRRDYPTATAHYEAALKLYPERVGLVFNLGYIAVQEGRIEDAIRRFRAALDLNPDFAEAHFLLGRIFAEQNELDKAAQAFERTIALKPEFADAHERLAYVYGLQRRNLDLAVEQVGRALALYPKSAAYWNTLSWLQYLRGDFAQSEAAITKALEFAPDNAVYRDGLQSIRQARQEAGQ